jgi:hypothetical protein
MPEALSLPWIIGIFIAFTGSSHAAAPVQVTAADTGRQIVLRTGQKLVVQLESNRSTGYTWSLAKPKSQILVSAGKPTQLDVSAIASATAQTAPIFQANSFFAIRTGEVV